MARAARLDALKLLRTDHEEVAALFKQAKTARGRKQAIVDQICQALIVHATIEEEIFYPACQAQVVDVEDVLAEAKVEHQTLKELIAKIGLSEPGEQYDAQVTVLEEYVKHHVKEEHTALFPKVRKSSLDLAELGQQLASRKRILQGDGGRRAA
ncbi:MAG TPA: hemerythrin domain-containing protein [Vineibacter sp.]|nr:hemerythrin domain-containing protein [Vineibacter sp.]